jgi:hypothetical protein
MDKTRLVIGPPARCGDLWDRDAAIAEIWKTLERDDVLLVAPRRFGKTSVMLNLMDHPREGYTVFYLDTEWVKGPVDFIAEVATELLKDSTVRQIFRQLGGFFSKMPSRIKAVQIMEFFKVELREEMAQDWHDKGREFISQLRSFDGNIVLIVDEFPLMIQRMLKESYNETEDFLYWMRGIRQMPDLSNLRFIMGGSIGIEHVLNKAGTGTKAINDLHRIQIGAFSEHQARQFIKVLLRNEANLKRVPSKLLDSFIEVIETAIPYFIQILVKESICEAESQQKPLSSELVHKAYHERVLASYNRTYFEHYYTRLGEHYPQEEEKIAKAFLLEIAKRNEISRSDLWNLYQSLLQGKGNEESFSYLLSDLENDFYIQFVPERRVYHFATKVLRDWWLRHHAIIE